MYQENFHFWIGFSWKDICTPFSYLNLNQNILTNALEEKQQERPYSMYKLLHNNIADYRAVPYPIESTVDWYLITNDISGNISL